MRRRPPSSLASPGVSTSPGRLTKRESPLMKPGTLMTAFAATLVACAVGAPAASATLTVDPLTVTEADGTLTFHFDDPESGAAVLIDSNDDAKADQIIRAWRTDAPNPPYASLSALTLSTTTCQEEKQGPQGQGGVTAVITSRWPAATGDDVTLTVPRSALPRTFPAKAISFAGPDTRPIPGGPNGYFLGACIITDLQGAVRFPVVATPVVPLDAPTGLTAVPGAWQVTLTWNPVERADGYNIYADGNLYQQTGPGLLSIPVFAQPGS